MNPEAKAKAISLLNARDYSRKMILDKLLAKAFSPADAEEVADWLCEMGLVDDARYAAMVVRHYGAKGYGAGRIRQELYRRGIAKELWEAAMEEMPPQQDTIERVLRAKLKGEFTPETKKKAAAAAQRRGYGWEEIRAALERLQNEDDTWMK